MEQAVLVGLGMSPGSWGKHICSLNVPGRTFSIGMSVKHFVFTLDILAVLVLLMSLSIDMNPVLHGCGVYEDIPAHKQADALEFIYRSLYL